MKPNNKTSKSILLLLGVWLLICLLVTGCGQAARTDASKVKGVDDLAGAVIGVQLGTTGDIYATEYEKKGTQVERYTKQGDAIEALKLGKVDCVVIDQSPANGFVARNADLAILPDQLVEEQYAICIAKQNKELKKKINLAIRTLQNNGTQERILKNYLDDTSKGKSPYISPAGVERSNGTLIVATNATFEPYEYMENGQIVGIDMDMAQAICDQLGMELKVENIEFDAIINAVQSGKAHIGIAGMTVTDDRLKSIDFTEPYIRSTQVIVVRNGEQAAVADLQHKLYTNFIEENRWQYMASGLGNTLQISFFAVIIGLGLGFLIAIVRSSYDKTGKFKLLNWLCKTYLNVIRGTPAMIQLLIIYYVVFASSDINKVFVAIIAFGLNSSAYIAEIVRSGINSIDNGQFEAGRSLGFSYVQTMRYFILPQAIKNVLPALGNEFIVLLKETSISGYIGIVDLTRGGDYIRSRTYEAFLPLMAVAIVYLILVLLLTEVVERLERRLKTDGR